jgi:hypothetical protein
MPGFEVPENFPRRPDLPLFCVFQTLTDTFFCIGTGGNVEQALIGFGILYDSRCLPFHRKHHSALCLFKLLHEIAGSAAKRRQGLDVVRNVKQGTAPMKAPF